MQLSAAGQILQNLCKTKSPSMPMLIWLFIFFIILHSKTNANVNANAQIALTANANLTPLHIFHNSPFQGSLLQTTNVIHWPWHFENQSQFHISHIVCHFYCRSNLNHIWAGIVFTKLQHPFILSNVDSNFAQFHISSTGQRHLDIVRQIKWKLKWNESLWDFWFCQQADTSVWSVVVWSPDGFLPQTSAQRLLASVTTVSSQRLLAVTTVSAQRLLIVTITITGRL